MTTIQLLLTAQVVALNIYAIVLLRILSKARFSVTSVSAGTITTDGNSPAVEINP